MGKLNMLAILNEYYDEVSWLNEAAARDSEPAPVPVSEAMKDRFWDDWYRNACLFEPDIEEKFEVDEWTGEVTSVNKNTTNRKAKRFLRRRATYFHKRSLKKTAAIVDKNLRKRFEEDEKLTKRRIDGEAVLSKSRTMQSERIIKRAGKIKGPKWSPTEFPNRNATADNAA